MRGSMTQIQHFLTTGTHDTSKIIARYHIYRNTREGSMTRTRHFLTTATHGNF